MPKVSQEYIAQKKEKILNAAFQVLHEKTLYEISMTDIIKAAGLSKGGIYLYYKDIDELIVEVLDKAFVVETLDKEMMEAMGTGDKLENKLKKLLCAYGSYLKNASVLEGKLQYEIKILLTKEKDRALKIRETIQIRKSGEYLNKKLYEIILELSDSNKEKADDLYTYATCFLEGMLEIYVLERCYGFPVAGIDVIKAVNMLADSLITMVDSKQNL